MRGMRAITIEWEEWHRQSLPSQRPCFARDRLELAEPLLFAVFRVFGTFRRRRRRLPDVQRPRAVHFVRRMDDYDRHHLDQLARSSEVYGYGQPRVVNGFRVSVFDNGSACMFWCHCAGHILCTLGRRLLVMTRISDIVRSFVPHVFPLFCIPQINVHPQPTSQRWLSCFVMCPQKKTSQDDPDRNLLNHSQSP